MASLVGHYFAKRRVDAEEAEVRRIAAAVAGPAAADAICVGDHAEDAPPLTFVPRCCYDGDPESAPPAYPIEVVRNLSYSAGGDADTEEVRLRVQAQRHGRHVLDIYFSPSAMRQRMRVTGESTVPVHVHVHGGGWQRGDKNNEWRGAPNSGRAAARHGYVSCCVSYRLSLPGILMQLFWTSGFSLLLVFLVSLGSSWVRHDFWIRWSQFLACCVVLIVAMRVWAVRNASKVRHPESVLDVALAVAWVKAHVAEHVPQADPSRLFLSGHSAGAHLVCLLATDARYLNAVGLPGLPRDHLRGVCSVSGIYLLHAPLSLTASTFRNCVFRAVYATPAFGCSKDALDDASPFSHASRDAPPVLLISAASDLGLEVDALRFAGRLRELGVPCEHHIVPHTSHASIASQFEKHAAHRHWFEFIEKYCNGEGHRNNNRRSHSSGSPIHVDMDGGSGDPAAAGIAAAAAAEDKRNGNSSNRDASSSIPPPAAPSSLGPAAPPSASTPLLASLPGGGDVAAGGSQKKQKRADSSKKKKRRGQRLA